MSPTLFHLSYVAWLLVAEERLTDGVNDHTVVYPTVSPTLPPPPFLVADDSLFVRDVCMIVQHAGERGSMHALVLVMRCWGARFQMEGLGPVLENK